MTAKRSLSSLFFPSRDLMVTTFWQVMVRLLIPLWLGCSLLEMGHVSADAYVRIAERFWGSEAAGDLTTYEGKALAAKMIQERQYAKESLVLCDYL